MTPAVYALIATGIICAAIAIFINFMKVPAGCQATGCGPTSQLKGPGCLWALESNYDPTIPTPEPMLWLIGYSASAQDGPPRCAPAWYAYRLVNTTTGAYSGLSPWSNPVAAGTIVTQGCPPPGCQAWGISSSAGSAGCTFNVPQLGLLTDPTIPGYSSSQWVFNIHRQIGPALDPTSEGEPIGTLIVAPYIGTPVPVVAYFFDLNNPDPGSQAKTCC